MDLNMMSNAELKIHLREMELEYEALQAKMKECYNRMMILDKNYTKTKEIINKRTKGWI